MRAEAARLGMWDSLHKEHLEFFTKMNLERAPLTEHSRKEKRFVSPIITKMSLEQSVEVDKRQSAKYTPSRIA
jgi:hypothetical protein